MIPQIDGRVLRVLAASVIAINLALCALWFVERPGGKTVFGPPLGADFAAFYVAGRILNQYPAAEIYNAQLHDRLYHELLPAVPPGESLPYAYAPSFALIFRPLALLPYRWAYLCWVACSLALYGGGLAVLWRACGAIPRREASLVFLLSFSFAPFLLESCLFGQVSAFTFFWVAVALAGERNGRHARAGASLAFLLYKPTVLFLILPALAAGRRLRALAGFALGAAALVAFTLAAMGQEACLAYARSLLRYAEVSTAGESVFRTWKFIDMNAFVRLLGWPRMVAGVCIAAAAAVLLWQWARRRSDAALLWAATLAWTPVFGIYGPIYDAVLLVPALLLLADRFYARGPKLPESFRFMAAVVYLVPWFTQALARATGVQIFTLIAAALGAYTLHAARQPAGAIAHPEPAVPCARDKGMRGG